MELKQKVIITSVTVGSAIVLAAIAYLIYFIVSSTINQPPDPASFGNPFVAKQYKDIDSLKSISNMRECKMSYNKILLSLNEDQINSFIDNDQYKNLDNRLNLAYTKHFIDLSKNYFLHSEWNNNDFIYREVNEIKKKGFVERNMPSWTATLQEFEDNISCYNEMRGCITEMNAVIRNLINWIPVERIADLKQQQQNLLNRKCAKNKAVETQLKNTLTTLETQAKENSRLSITPLSLEFDARGGSQIINVNTNVSSWSYTAVYSWISISKSGTTLTITCKENPNTNERKDEFEIKALEKTVKVRIRQKAKENTTLTVTPTTLEFDAAIGSNTINVNTNASLWTFSSVPSWLSVRKNGSFLTVSCRENTNTYERTGDFTINALEKSVKINITQKGKVPQNYTTKATVDSIWVDHNVTQDGNIGMRIHVKFDVEGMLNRQGSCVVWFYLSDGTKLPDTNGQYKTTDGKVATSAVFKPSYASSTFRDFSIFMPYTELHIEQRGTHKLRLIAGIIDHNNNQIATSRYVYFELNNR